MIEQHNGAVCKFPGPRYGLDQGLTAIDKVSAPLPGGIQQSIGTDQGRSPSATTTADNPACSMSASGKPPNTDAASIRSREDQESRIVSVLYQVR